MSEHVCMGCGAPRERDWVEITTLSDPEPVYMPGAWGPCMGCGSMTAPAEIAPCIGPMHGPPVPTPDDILQGAAEYGWWRW